MRRRRQSRSSTRTSSGDGNFYLEIQDQGLEQERKIQADLFRLEKELDIPLVLTNDSHYLCGEDSHAHDVMLCVQTGAKIHDADRFRFDSDQFFVKSADEMARLFPDSPGVMQRTMEIAERCHLKLHRRRQSVSGVCGSAGAHHRQLLRRGVLGRLEKAAGYGGAATGVARASGARRREEYESRLRFEIGIIKQMKYSGYFLIVWDFIKYARDNGIPVGPGRGSATGSLVAYAMEITNIDPMQNVLLFERFLNPERVTMPDIDVDFCRTGAAK